MYVMHLYTVFYLYACMYVIYDMMCIKITFIVFDKGTFLDKFVDNSIGQSNRIITDLRKMS